SNNVWNYVERLTPHPALYFVMGTRPQNNVMYVVVWKVVQQDSWNIKILAAMSYFYSQNMSKVLTVVNRSRICPHKFAAPIHFLL
ncbi:hypothetical protein, partial [Klebsiella pneumoniae]|uniref:hypothetical protein n=1 Tax=Klebsiella pneumoniae TaxID=573 RepID=UPI0039C2CE0A